MTIQRDVDLVGEFPDLERRIRELESASPGFAALFAVYERTDREIRAIVQQRGHGSASALADLEKRRARLWDRLYAMLRE